MKIVNILNLYETAGANSQGEKLFSLLETELDAGEILEINFSGVYVLSTSFLNSSFGEIASRKGVDYMRGKIKFTGLTPTNKLIIEKYFNQLQGEYA